MPTEAALQQAVALFRGLDALGDDGHLQPFRHAMMARVIGRVRPDRSRCSRPLNDWSIFSVSSNRLR